MVPAAGAGSGSVTYVGDPTVKQFGVGLSVAVLLAGTMTLLLAPALLSVFGRWTWILPRWLAKVIPHVDKKLAMERISRIKVPHIAFFNRDHDHMQGLFELAYTWVKEGGHPDTEHFSFEHDVHGYLLRVKKDDKGVYQPDAVQLKAIPAAIDFFNRSMKAVK